MKLTLTVETITLKPKATGAGIGAVFVDTVCGIVTAI